MASPMVVGHGPDPVQGWGTGHQGEALFSTAAPAFDTYRMPYGLPRPQQQPASTRYNSPYYNGNEDEDFDDDDEDIDDLLDPYDAIYGELDLSRVQGQQLAIWTHKSPDTLALFTPIPGDSFINLVSFARTSLRFNTAVDKMMILLPGHQRPLDMDSVFIIKPGTAILISPLYDYMVSLEVKQLGHRIDMVVNLTMTVLELKSRLHTERGYPVERTELLYRDRPLENSRYLFDYSLVHGSTIFVLLTLKNDVLVHVETFWGKQYHLYVDTCSTGFNIIASVLRRTVSQMVVDVVRLYELFLPKHTLVLYLGSRAIDWDTCLGFYDIENGSVLRMSTIGLAHDMAIQKVPLILESGISHHILVSKFDRWSAVVLKLHGMTGYPVNLMRLLRPGNHRIDFSDSVGYIAPHSPAIHLDVSAINSDHDLLYGIPLRFKVAKGVTELLKVAPTRTIKSVKDTLERVGVPNASIYDLLIDDFRLPNNKRVVDVIEEYKKPIQMSLRQYPVFIHGPHNVIYKMLAYSKETLATFLVRVKMKTGLSFKDYALLSCGQVLREDENKPVFETKLSVKSSVFLTPRKQHRTFFILSQDWLTKLRIPIKARPQQIKDILWKNRNVPEGGLASIGNFLQWYFSSHTGAASVQTKRKGPDEKLLTYEASVGDKFMHMKVEQPGRRRRDRKDRHHGHNGAVLRHRSAGPGHLEREGHHYSKRKAFTSMSAQKRRGGEGGQQGQDGGENNNGDEWVFCLRHDYTVNTHPKGRRHTRHQ